MRWTALLGLLLTGCAHSYGYVGDPKYLVPPQPHQTICCFNTGNFAAVAGTDQQYMVLICNGRMVLIPPQ